MPAIPGAGRDMKEPFLLKPSENLIPALPPQAATGLTGGQSYGGFPEQQGP